jgi:Sec7 domain
MRVWQIYIFSDVDVVHALAYSIFLLNTDLHVVDISSSQRMTRQQFVRNTMHTILSQLPSSKRISTDPIRSSIPKGKLTTFPSVSSPNLSHLAAPSINRSGSLLKVGQAVGMSRNPSTQSLDHGTSRVSRDSVRTAATAERLSWSLFDEKVGPFGGMASFGSQSAWEAQMECVLKA